MATQKEHAELAANSGRTSSTVTFAAAPADGELIKLTISMNNALRLGNITAPSGFTKIDTRDAQAAGNGGVSETWAKVAGASETASYTFTHNTMASAISGYVIQDHGVSDVSTDISVFGETSAGSTVTSLNVPDPAESVSGGEVSFIIGVSGDQEDMGLGTGGSGYTIDTDIAGFNIGFLTATNEHASGESVQVAVTTASAIELAGALVVVPDAAAASNNKRPLAGYGGLAGPNGGLVHVG